VLCNNLASPMHPPRAVLERVEQWFEQQGLKYREAYLAQVEQFPESKRRIGPRDGPTSRFRRPVGVSSGGQGAADDIFTGC
jgi:hypothetical protein